MFRNVKRSLLIFFLSMLSVSQAIGGASFLPTEPIGAKSFIQNHPEFDGRGTVIFILDSGVDPAVPGLQTTTTGEPKIPDVLDFSGQGDVELEIGTQKTEGNEIFIEHPDGFRLHNPQRLPQQPLDGEYFIGYLDESWFLNSQVDDLNNNDLVDDQFGVLVFKTGSEDSSEFVAFIDTDADGHVDDETPVFDFAARRQIFQLRGRNSARKPNLLNFALKIQIDQMRVSFHFDDSGHGTHVAGIAAGHEIYGQPDLQGIAPGAQIISLKIGDNSLAGNATVTGSMHQAFLYTARWSRQHPEKKVVINLSYSLGAETPGEADIERFLSALLEEYPHLVICVSAGNLGPGIASVGTPGSCADVITTGALLDVETARDLYGVTLNRPKLFFFSSRGGDRPKPDLVAPGVAVSSVPPFEADDKKYGASMASPQVAGAAALLLSAFPKENQPGHTLIKKALCAGANLLPDYSFLDQGSGVPQVEKSYQFLKAFLAERTSPEVIEYSVSTENPETPGKSGDVAYWRSGGYFPGETEKVQFSVRPRFAQNTPPDQQHSFFRAYELASNVPWLVVHQKFVHIRGDNATPIDASYRNHLLKQPGLYAGKITAWRKGKNHSPENVDFELPHTLVVPYQFDFSNQFQHRFARQKIAPGECLRYFLLVPPGASAMNLEFAPPANAYCAVFPVIFDPAGRRIDVLDPVQSERRQAVTKVIADEDLIPGIWEIDIYAPFTEQQASFVDFDVQFSGLQIKPDRITGFDYPIGAAPKGQFTVTNYFTPPQKCKAQGLIAGWRRTRQVPVSGERNRFEYRFRQTEEIEKIVFKIKIPPESFRLFTNISVNILNPAGNFVVQDGLTYSEKSISLENAAPGIYKLEVTGARTYSHGASNWELELTEYFYQKSDQRILLEISQKDRAVFSLYPHIPTPLDFTFSAPPPVAPDGFSLFGLIIFRDHASTGILSTIRLHFDTSFH